MEIRLAHPAEAPAIVAFFEAYITRGHNGIPNEEFFCPDGARAAAKRNQILVAVEHHRIAGALRFYPKKESERISLYQFAVAENYRGQRLLNRMLHTAFPIPVDVTCPLDSSFNGYYDKSGWTLAGQTARFNRWVLNP
ncbi:GNAT family N-acetyltransferase [Paenibacillus apiarius]|uniref:GNAT family N-acetyltransferase n=1 Tax=Paenibacillus apiarius TaxID=46240 RepID=A0ABT4DMN8_9BACL|nr:GNAT family N-acetyltransferase [Paenibacillus apiarius]MBN3522519.1 GNAT family N-acetyltransferase [Paenibacillus apiarius]MCY9514626.1 GNAT family N-acetyltransferase [Paenibacillus apiarius]MCY9518616.1 GNAT family N-acetyltransferase [Paenibacillus apiarius]MCY9552704.1 GNAT family N-acetyltransferase [Paenibacillus apiarius]MCY9556968.1 GNAT family N-acetyltransferase [Paenibacillus apiarius]